MFYMNNTLREAHIIEVYEKNTLIGTFINMNTANRVLPKNKLYSYSHSVINENHKYFWELIRKGYVMNMPELTKEEQKMLGLNLKDPDAIVKYIIEFYGQNGVKSEQDLVEKLTEHKPLRRAIELQKERVK